MPGLTLVTALSESAVPPDLGMAAGVKQSRPALGTWRLPQAECPRVRAAAVARAPRSWRSPASLPCLSLRSRGAALPALPSPRAALPHARSAS